MSRENTLVNPDVPTPVAEAPWEVRTIIGQSVEGRDIETYTYGNGPTKLLFVGGVHGGYEWNSVLLAYRFIDYMQASKSLISDRFTISIIPSLNPDGVYKVTEKPGRFSIVDVVRDSAVEVSGRFNANKVDLNRNFDCKWQPKATWRSSPVSAGTSAFSEPESIALRDYVALYDPSAAVFWHSQANAVYASECKSGILPVTLDIMNAYSTAAKYKPVSVFDAYPVTGDAEGWLASIGIPAITVELSSHDSVEWEKNLAGFKATLQYFTDL